MQNQFALFEKRLRRLNWVFRWLGFLPDTLLVLAERRGQALLREMVAAYRNANESGRATLRKLTEANLQFAQNVALPRPVSSAESFHDHLVHFSLIYHTDDWRDLVVWLDNLCQEAIQAGVTIEPILRKAGAMSSDAELETERSAKQDLLDAASRTDVWKARAKQHKSKGRKVIDKR
jgi:hypothetical protein